MSKEKKPITDPDNEDRSSDDVPVARDGHYQELEQLFDNDESETAPEQGTRQFMSPELAQELDKQLEVISGDLKSCREDLSCLAKEINELKAAEQIIANLNAHYKELSEQFHEREIVLPVINCLVRLVDSCHQQLDRFQKIHAKHVNSKNRSATKVLTFLIETRKANLVEFENALAYLGVESYQHHDVVFDPSQQRCINRIGCENEALGAHIAERLLSGYRRYDKIVRKECVDVYVTGNKTRNTNGGN